MCDLESLHNVVCDYFPDVVFHAAAYKHVPLVEENRSKTMVNNIMGTKILLVCLLKLVLNHLFLFLQIRQLDQQMLLLNPRPFLDLAVNMTCA